MGGGEGGGSMGPGADGISGGADLIGSGNRATCVSGDSRVILLGCADGTVAAVAWSGKVRSHVAWSGSHVAWSGSHGFNMDR